MEIPDLKQLKALLQLCRKQGIVEFTLGDFSCKLGDLPEKVRSYAEEEIEEQNQLQESDMDALVGMPTPEEIASWSQGLGQDEQ